MTRIRSSRCRRRSWFGASWLLLPDERSALRRAETPKTARQPARCAIAGDARRTKFPARSVRGHRARPPPEATPQLAHDLCVAFADRRTEGEPLAGVAQRWQLDLWRADGAASSIYPLARAEGRFDMEECHVLVKRDAGAKAPRATYL